MTNDIDPAEPGQQAVAGEVIELENGTGLVQWRDGHRPPIGAKLYTSPLPAPAEAIPAFSLAKSGIVVTLYFDTNREADQAYEFLETNPFLSVPTPKENIAYFTNDRWGGYWQTVRGGKPYNFRQSPAAEKEIGELRALIDEIKSKHGATIQRANELQEKLEAAECHASSLEAALEPFAKAADDWSTENNGGHVFPDNVTIDGATSLTVGDLRNARRARDPKKGGVPLPTLPHSGQGDGDG